MWRIEREKAAGTSPRVSNDAVGADCAINLQELWRWVRPARACRCPVQGVGKKTRTLRAWNSLIMLRTPETPPGRSRMRSNWLRSSTPRLG